MTNATCRKTGIGGVRANHSGDGHAGHGSADCHRLGVSGAQGHCAALDSLTQVYLLHFANFLINADKQCLGHRFHLLHLTIHDI